MWDDLDGRTLHVYNPEASLFPASEQKNLAKFKQSLPKQTVKQVVNPYKKAKR
jgi:hypothetical protein